MNAGQIVFVLLIAIIIIYVLADLLIPNIANYIADMRFKKYTRGLSNYRENGLFDTSNIEKYKEKIE